MDYQSLYLKTVVELRRLAKEMGVRIPSGVSKAVIIDLILEAARAAESSGTNDARIKENTEAGEAPEEVPETQESTVPDTAPAFDADSEEGREPSDAVRFPHEMRVAQHPQVVDRRPVTGGYADSGNADDAERAYTDNRNRSAFNAKPGYVRQDGPGRVSQQPAKPGLNRQDGANPRYDNRQDGVNTRYDNRSDGANLRYDKRQDNNQQNRFAARQDGYPAQNRYGQRYDANAQQGRSGARQDAQEYRARNDGQYRQADSQNRFRWQDGAGENRNRFGRQDSQENRPSAWNERQDANRFYYEENSARSYGENQRGTAYAANTEGREWYRSQSGQDINTPDDPETVSPRYDNGRPRYYNEEYRTSNPAAVEMLEAGECTEGAGILEVQPDGYGFLRAENYQQGSRDVYVSIAQIRRFNLRMGDHVVGQTRPQREGDRYTAMMYITSVNGRPPEEMIGRKRFEDLVPVYPTERLRLEQPGENDLSLRMIDMLAPIGKGQRGLIVSQPKAGKTTLLKKLAHAITSAHPEIHLIVLLIDERPEEVTEMQRSIDGEVVYSTFDEMPENHARVSEMVLERAQRLVELGQDVVILMDSITRLARAYNLVIPPTGRSLSGGLDPGALHKPKRFFGAARNTEDGGSLTVIATALTDTGSRMDDIIYEEFKGTGNMEMHLDRKLSDKRIFPAVDMVRSGTRRDELLLNEAELEGANCVRRMLSSGNEQGDAEKIIGCMEKTATNEEFFQRLNAYQSVYEKSGYSMNREITK